ncbi:phosphatase PAP2 family protein [Salinispirillum sp. LH 10-3-1]|uniref:undecaprenyl-diphosphate phosphatase n=1 Tax=Salinispirillum sp. LH 10-3-1 TaxID=2952525 RepID=A0AB38YJB4_9GAMM
MTKTIFASIHQIDVRTFTWCMGRKRRERITWLSRHLSRTADGPMYLVAALVLYFFYDGFTTAWANAMLLAIAVERVLYLIIKKGFKRNRPQEALVDFRSFIRPSDQFSFPSGHTSCAFLFATFMATLFPQFTVVWFIWASSIAFSRVFLGVHFPTDTMVGAVMGSATAWWTIGMMGL